MAAYKSFPQANLIREWDKLLKLSKKEVADLYDEWKIIHQENEETNRRLYHEKSAKIQEIADNLKKEGIDVFKYKRSGFIPQKNGYQAWFKNNVVDIISKQYPHYHNGIPTAHMSEVIVDGVRITNNQSPTTIIELHDRISWQYNKGLKEVQKVDKLLIKSIEYAAKNKIDIEDLNPKEIICTVNDEAKTKYLEEHVPDGTEVYLKHECDECSTYIMGEHRCSCGNRRISVIVEGDLIEGFTHYPEAN